MGVTEQYRDRTDHTTHRRDILGHLYLKILEECSVKTELFPTSVCFLFICLNLNLVKIPTLKNLYAKKPQDEIETVTSFFQ